MNKGLTCMVCGEEYHRDAGPMICVCTPCLNKPPPQPAYIEQRGLFIPNPESAAK